VGIDVQLGESYMCHEWSTQGNSRLDSKRNVIPLGVAPEQIVPKSLGDYLEIQTKAVFQSGMSWKVVESKWPTIREAFNEFQIGPWPRWTSRR